MIEAPAILTTDALHTAQLHIVTSWSEIGSVMSASRARVYDFLAQRSISPYGPWFNHYLMLSPQGCEFDLSVPVAQPIASADGITAGEWPATEVARTVYHGSYDRIATGWAELDKWIEASGRKHRDDAYERYLVVPGEDGDSSACQTELNFPLIAAQKEG